MVHFGVVHNEHLDAQKQNSFSLDLHVQKRRNCVVW